MAKATIRKKTRRQIKKESTELYQLRRAIKNAQEYGPNGFLQSLDEEIGAIIESQLETTRPQPLSWHEKDTERFHHETSIIRKELKKIKGIPLIGSDAEGRVVVQGNLKISPSRSHHTILVYPSNFPEEPPAAFSKVDGGMAPLDLEGILEWTRFSDSREVLVAVAEACKRENQ